MRMSRKIEFRGKRIDNGKWVYGDYFKTPLTDENSGTKSEAGWFFLTGELRHCIGQDNVAFTVDEKTVGQFTGLRDKNGKKIFEADIVKIDDREIGAKDIIIGEVYWCADYTLWKAGPGFCVWSKKGHSDLSPNIEIIGNIYENPELLGEK